MRIAFHFVGAVAAATLFAACSSSSTTPNNNNPPPNTPSITTSSLAAGTVGIAYSQTIAVTGGTQPDSFAVSSGALPGGLMLNVQTGKILGTPTSQGMFSFTIKVTDSEMPPASDTKNLSIQVNAAAGGSYSWSQIMPGGTAPAGRSSFGAITDTVHHQMIVALGSSGVSTGTVVYPDSFAMGLNASMEAWSSLPALAHGRWGHSLVFDSTRTRAILFGGNVDGFTNSNDVWALDLSNPGMESWSQLMPSGNLPTARLEQGAVYDAPHDRMIVFGGGTGFDPVFAPMNDVWSLDFSGGAQGTWTKLTPSGTAPMARAAMVAVFDSVHDRMIVFSGGTTQPTGVLGDVWALDLSSPGNESWTHLSPSGTAPAAREYSAGAYDPVRDTLVIWGGENGMVDLGDVWELTLTPGSEAWTQLMPTGTAPTPRDSHSAVYDGVNRRIVFYAGFTLFPSTPFTDVWALNLP